jgi:hypothetical protein
VSVSASISWAVTRPRVPTAGLLLPGYSALPVRSRSA